MLRWIFVLLIPFSLSAQLKRFQFSEKKMGSPFTIIFYHGDSTHASQLAFECFLLVDSINAIFSDYLLSSEAGRLTQQQINQEQSVSNELFDLIRRSGEAWRKSGKTFDITVGALSSLWRKARVEQRFPSKKEVRNARKITGFKKLILDEKNKTVSLKIEGMRLDFGGIAKGYATQRVIDYLKSKNITHALADGGGDISMSDAPPGKNGWTIAINSPKENDPGSYQDWDKKLELTNSSVATSGDLYQFIYHNGKKYSHIINPRTGYGVTSQRNVTVIAKDGAAADWLATACSILPLKKAIKLAKKENAALFIANQEEEKIIIHKTENFDRYFQKKEP